MVFCGSEMQKGSPAGRYDSAQDVSMLKTLR
jgi:hypothetical protein